MTSNGLRQSRKQRAPHPGCYTNIHRRNLNMEVNIKTLLHPRIEKHCEILFDDGHYKHAASEAMIQVELALKEKSGEKKSLV